MSRLSLFCFCRRPASAGGVLALFLLLLTSFPAAAAEISDWLVLVYMSGGVSESSVGNASADIAEMVEAQTDPSRVRVVIQTGGARKWNMFGIPADSLIRYTLEQGTLREIGRAPGASMASPDTLADFLRFAQERYQGRQTMLIIWDHSTGGATAGVVHDEIHSSVMRLPELQQGIRQGAAMLESGKYDIIFFDADAMATVDTVHFMLPLARYMLASEKVSPWMAWDYTAWLYRLSEEPLTGPADLARMMITTYMISASEAGYSDISLTLVDLARSRSLLLDLQRLGCALAFNLQKGIITQAELDRMALKASLYGYGTFQFFEPDLVSDQVDLGDFHRQLESHFPREIKKLREDFSRAVPVFASLPYTGGSGLATYYPLSRILHGSGSDQQFASQILSGFQNYMLAASPAPYRYMTREGFFSLLERASENYRLQIQDQSGETDPAAANNDGRTATTGETGKSAPAVPGASAGSGSAAGTGAAVSPETGAGTPGSAPDQGSASAGEGVPAGDLVTGAAGGGTASVSPSPEECPAPEGDGSGKDGCAGGRGSEGDGASRAAAAQISPEYRRFTADDEEHSLLVNSAQIVDNASGGDPDEADDGDWLEELNAQDACEVPVISAMAPQSYQETGKSRKISRKKRQALERKRDELRERHARGEVDFDTYADSMCALADRNSSFDIRLFCGFVPDGETGGVTRAAEIPMEFTPEDRSRLRIPPELLRKISDVNFAAGLVHAEEPGKASSRNLVLDLGFDERMLSDWEKGEFTDSLDGTWITLDGHPLPIAVISSTPEYVTYVSRIRLNRKDALLLFAQDLTREDRPFEIICCFFLDRTSSPHLLSRKLTPGDIITIPIPAVTMEEVARRFGTHGSGTVTQETGSESGAAGSTWAADGEREARKIHYSTQVVYQNSMRIARTVMLREPLVFKYVLFDDRGNRLVSDVHAVRWSPTRQRTDADDELRAQLEIELKAWQERRAAEETGEKAGAGEKDSAGEKAGAGQKGSDGEKGSDGGSENSAAGPETPGKTGGKSGSAAPAGKGSGDRVPAGTSGELPGNDGASRKAVQSARGELSGTDGGSAAMTAGSAHRSGTVTVTGTEPGAVAGAAVADSSGTPGATSGSSAAGSSATPTGGQSPAGK